MLNTDYLELLNFGARRGGFALSHPLTLNIKPGTVLGVVGPNGVGKSSLLSAVAHTRIARYGSALYGRRTLSQMTSRQRAKIISMLTQDLRAPDELLVKDLVAVGARAGGAENVDEQVASALEMVGAIDLADRAYGTLSGGWRQLVQIARVIAQDTPIVILDEPTAALDLRHQRSVEQLLRRLGNEGKIVICALHDLSMALNACTKILLLDREGRSHAGAPHDVLNPELVHQAYGVQTSVHTTSRGRRFITTEDCEDAKCAGVCDAATVREHTSLGV
ncbi:ABC transporter ATP-binding protein [Leucobacter sp. OH1287]|uniref:ABC transporter ATP-binding protein n=1 Tax=Leucobacter sp. OH1287 TaxID=2491049 RepID=UPI000F5F3AB7|nr:ABC transporter ATP-binding protein [Leucobacter sp. OH1287]RRD60044.1 ABC transporter ATP-binding protein [Leucobacter sp. OH1287]